MSDSLYISPELEKPVEHLHKAEELLRQSGHWESLEILTGWVTRHHYCKVENELSNQISQYAQTIIELRKKNKELQEQLDKQRVKEDET